MTGHDHPVRLATQAVAQTDEGKPVTIDVLANDTANAALAIDKGSLAITSNPSNGSVKVNADDTVTYTPDAGYGGATDSFKYTVTDDNGATSLPAPS